MSSEVKKGGTSDLPETQGGDQRPAPDDTNVARQKALAEEIICADREVLQALAK